VVEGAEAISEAVDAGCSQLVPPTNRKPKGPPTAPHRTCISPGTGTPAGWRPPRPCKPPPATAAPSTPQPRRRAAATTTRYPRRPRPHHHPHRRGPLCCTTAPTLRALRQRGERAATGRGAARSPAQTASAGGGKGRGLRRRCGRRAAVGGVDGFVDFWGVTSSWLGAVLVCVDAWLRLLKPSPPLQTLKHTTQ